MAKVTRVEGGESRDVDGDHIKCKDGNGSGNVGPNNL